MTVDELPTYLVEHGAAIRAQLLDGTYQPKPVRRQEIPKRGGGVRELGIPCVLDRLIQQAILQVLQPMFDSTFSEHSHGFRPGRNAHDAVCEAQRYVQEGKRVVVDVDLEKFFDRVCHDVLMGRLEKRIGDKRMLGLIRRYLEAGIMTNGVVMERHEGAPQGGPLSPLMANVLLDEVDKELEKRGIAFVRYADDLNVYVGSKRGADVMGSSVSMRARLRINEARVRWRDDRRFLGYGFWNREGGRTARGTPSLGAMVKRPAHDQRNGGRGIQRWRRSCGYLVGWRKYYRRETPGVFETSTRGFATDCEWSNSNSGNVEQRCTARCVPGVFPSS
jgi:group II intron reverse transcriptase/maturase